MATYAPLVSTWNIAPADGGPRRPSLDDVGGAGYVNDTANPPDPTMPNAQAMNQGGYQLNAGGSMMPLARVWVLFVAGSPFVSAVQSPTADALTGGFFTVTDNGNGDTTISWVANSLPPTTGSPKVTLTCVDPSAPPTVQGAPVAGYVTATSARIVTRTTVGADHDFCLEIC